MAWTVPRTWVAKEVVTAALLNTHVKDNLIDLDTRAPVYGDVAGEDGTATSGTAEEVMATFTIPANTLDANGATIHLAAWGTMTENANNKTARLRWGTTGSPLSGTICATMSSGTGNLHLGWVLEAYISRIASNSQGIMGMGDAHSATLFGDSDARHEMTLATASLTDSNALAFVVTCDSVVTGDMTFGHAALSVFTA